MSDRSTINRRKFISAGWTDPDTALPEPRGEIASILVQARPERLAEVEAAICALHGCEIHGRDPKGKLVVVVDSPNDGAIGDILNRIAMTDGVLSAALVFHAIDAG
jgi:nitrate reductase NapD